MDSTDDDNTIGRWAAEFGGGAPNETHVEAVFRAMAAASGGVEVVSPARWPDRYFWTRRETIAPDTDLLVAPFIARQPSWHPSHWVLVIGRRHDRSVFVLDPFKEDWLPSVASAGVSMMSMARCVWPQHAQSWAIYYPIIERLDGLQSVDDTALAVCEWARRIIGAEKHTVSPQALYMGIESAVGEWKDAMSN